MSTKTENVSSKLSSLPISRHIDLEKMGLDPTKWKKGEKNIFRIISIALIAGAGIALWVYLIPILFAVMVKTLAVLAFAGGMFLLYTFRKPLYKMLRGLSRGLHKSIIKSRPFAELEVQREKMFAQKEQFRDARITIRKLRNQAQELANKNANDAKSYKAEITSDRKTAEKLKKHVVAMEQANQKDTDEYVEIKTKFTKKLNSARRTMHLYEQANTFGQKYGVRASAMGRLERKLALVGNAVDDKLADFDVSVDMLKKEYDFAKSARIATDSARSIMGLTSNWELEYALEVVTDSIAQNLAVTSENLSDIDSLTEKYQWDDDRLYDELDAIANKFASGEEEVIDTDKYRNPEYRLTPEDRSVSGGFTDLMN
jgi:ribosomal protein L22